MAVTGRCFSKTTIFCLLAGVAGLFAVSGVWYINAIKPPKIINLQDLAPKEEVIESLDPVYLKTLSAPEPVRRHLLDGEFTIVYRMQDISQRCRAPFESSFLRFSRTVPKKPGIDFADPGQDFNYGDSIIEGLPFRQLHFAGLGRNSCFIYYQQGGRIYPSSCLAVMEYVGGKAIWVGVVAGGKAARNFRELRAVFFQHKYYDSGERDC
jgi:hypothetical protein